MILDTWVPIAASGVFGLLAPVAARRLPPAHATWLLSLGGGITATCAAVSLGLLGSAYLGQLPPVAAEGRWSATELRQADPTGHVLPIAALALLGALLLAALTVLALRVRALARARRAARRLPPAMGELVVVDDGDVGAFALPGRPGRIVVSRTTLSALDPTERRALLAHERSHLHHHHHRHLAAAAVAAAVNPLLLRVPAALAQSVERWADEDAARAIDARHPVATALARTALLSTRRRPVAGSLAAAAAAVPARVAALLAGPPRPRPALVLAAAVTVVVAAAATVEAATDTAHVFDLAMQAYRAVRG